jgi:hypothetical protein
VISYPLGRPCVSLAQMLSVRWRTEIWLYSPLRNKAVVKPSLFAGIEYAGGQARRWFPTERAGLTVFVLEPLWSMQRYW